MEMPELLFRVCNLLPDSHSFTRLFLNICAVDEESDVVGLGELQREILTGAFQTASVKLRDAVLSPLGRLGPREIDLLYSLAVQYKCSHCKPGAELCKACTMCSQDFCNLVTGPAPGVFHTHAHLGNNRLDNETLARAEVFTNHLYRGLRTFEAEWTEEHWEHLDASLPKFGPFFARWCVAIMFDGWRLRRVCHSDDINGGDTMYDLHRVQLFVRILEGALRRAGCMPESAKLQTALAKGGTTVSQSRFLLAAVAEASANALQKAFTQPMFERDGDSLSLFDALKRCNMPLLQSVAYVFGSAFLNAVGKPMCDGFAFADSAKYPPAPPAQSSSPWLKKLHKSELAQRAAAGYLKVDTKWTKHHNRPFQCGLTLAMVTAELGDSAATGNTQVQTLLLSAVSQTEPVTQKDIQTALFTKGPLAVFTLESFRVFAKDWKDDELHTISGIYGGINTGALKLAARTINLLDAIHLSSGAASPYVTRVLNTLSALSVTVYQWSQPSWDVLVDRFVQRKRKGERG